MASFGTTRSDVHAWPHDPQARHILEQYLDEYSAGTTTEVPDLPGLLEDFRGADLSGLSLAGASFFNANLEGVRFRGAYLWKANLDGALASGADFTDADMRQTEFSQVIARGAMLDGANLAGVDMFGTDLRDSSVRRANFGGGSVVRTDLSGADIRGTSFRGVAFGDEDSATRLTGALVGDNALGDAFGVVAGPVNLGSRDQPRWLDGEDLAAWFAERGAPGIEVVTGG